MDLAAAHGAKLGHVSTVRQPCQYSREFSSAGPDGSVMNWRRTTHIWTACFAAGVALSPLLPGGVLITVTSILLAFSPLTAPAAFVLAGSAAARLQSWESPPSATGEEVRLEGRVASVPVRSRERVRFLLRRPEGPLLDVSAPQAPFPLALGDQVALSARLDAPPPALNPGGRDRAAQ